MSKRREGFPNTVYGISPLGGSFEDSSEGTISGVPLFYDPHTGTYQSEQAIEEQDERALSIARKEATLEEETFRRQVGFLKP